ncbi:MAG: bifunctional 3-phosphoshikimate 1-carboxyvinyltransferase/cytidylate kinase [Burkholderiales bacterium]|nr:bifunctional 3-phosphoshikimate 1-carboxyvinyltransferase/cytidylate kinase [Burkholderiales bacterium]
MPPLGAAGGTVRLPGSKSISNRTLLLAALADGVTEIRDLLDSDDTRHMLEALDKLGVDIAGDVASGVARITGCRGRFPVRAADLFLGNAGTAFRPLTAVLALAGGHYRLSGVPRMHERPIGDLVEGLRAIGADIRFEANDGFPPLAIGPGAIRPLPTVRVRGDVSSQFLTALLMALPLTGAATVIEVDGELISKPYIDITLNLMARFGIEVRREGWERFTIPAGAHYRSPGTVPVEGDASGASYFLAAGAIGGGPLRIEGVGRTSIQGDVRFADALEQLGARITWGDTWIEASGPANGRLKAFDLDLNHIPDAAMTLAVAALFTDGPCRLRNVASWRVKETDRLTAMATELRKVGATVEEGPDFLRVTPAAALHGAAIDTYDDHRIAMCFSLVALGGVPMRINDPGCVAKTFPDYFQRFASVTRPAHVPVVALDGPAASGKGTVALLVARQLGWHLLESGALYRVVGLAALEQGVDLQDERALAPIAAGLDVAFDEGRVWLSGRDVSDRIRSEQVSDAASKVAALPAVRAALLWRQKAFRAMPGLVAEGRDMGSVVFPDASPKVFLTATAKVRAERRYKQLIAKGMDVNLPALLQEIASRDERDSQRSVAPLKAASDALPLDTTELSAEEAANQVVAWVRQRSSST